MALHEIGDPVGVWGLYFGPTAATVWSVSCVLTPDVVLLLAAATVLGKLVAQLATYRPINAPAPPPRRRSPKPS